jgi:hypothetical protein
MKDLAVLHRRAPKMPSYGQADEGSHRHDEHRRGRDQRDRQDRTSDLSFAPIPLEFSVKL